MLSNSGCRIEISLAERRSPATFPILQQRNFKAERFENFDRRDADVRLVVTHKSVVPKNDLASSVAAVCDPRTTRPAIGKFRHISAQPPIKTLVGVGWQR